MTRKSRKMQRRIIASLMTGVFMLQQTMALSVVASDITGVTGANGVYNIDPATKSGATGFRGYTNFNLDQGDVANLNFADINTFVNLVDNQININGIVNSVRGNNFYNGKAIFISPNGMVVGASGVLNVGSLGVYSPDTAAWNKLKNDQTEKGLAEFTSYEPQVGGAITINGKVVTSGDVDLAASSVTIGKDAVVAAGVNKNMMQKLSSKEQANTLFNNLVNTDNLVSGNQFASDETGHVKIFANGIGNIDTTVNGTGLKVAGTIMNYAQASGSSVDLKTRDNANGMDITGTISNANGKVSLFNEENNLNISGTIRNGGDTEIKNLPWDGAGTESAINVTGTGNIDTKGNLTIINEAKNGMNLDGTITTQGDSNVVNGYYNSQYTPIDTATMNIGGTFTTKGNAVFRNTSDGVGGMNVTGTVNVGKQGSFYNDGAGGLNVTNPANITTADGLIMTNTGNDGLNISGKVTNTGDATITNTAGGVNGLNVKNGGVVTNNNGTVAFTNDGEGGLNIDGSVLANASNANFANTGAGGLNVTGTVNADKKGTFTNSGAKGLNIKNTGKVTTGAGLEMTNSGNDGLNIDGAVTNTGEGLLTNTEGGVNGLNINGTVTNNNGLLTANNAGAGGLNVSGSATNNSGNIRFVNTGAAGTNIASTGRVTASGDVLMNDTSKGGTNIKGLVKGNNVTIDQKGGGNVTIGDDTENNNYVTADNNIAITVNNGSIKNFGAEKVLLKAGGDLTMDVTDGTIGEAVQQNGLTGSRVGIGPKGEGARDFTKSINANVNGKVKAQTKKSAVDKAAKPDDLVINYAAIDSDMNIDTIKADGRVILTVDDDYGDNNTGVHRYNMVNARTDNSGTNIEGTGISLISNGSIGTKDNPVTFIQTGAEQGYSMDVLAENNINLKENSYNDANYGKTKEIKTNKADTIIARKGDANVEFAGNTTINDITAEGDLNVVTRGKTMEIKNLGHITDESVIPADYLGPRDYGMNDNASLPGGGYTAEDYGHEALPNNANIKALDINHNIRTTDAQIEVPQAGEGLFDAYAGSSVKVDNAVLDKGKLDITADNVYANGIAAHFNNDGFSKTVDPSTNKVIGSDGIPTGHAVRPDDVSGIGRDIHERNYYYPEGDGDGTFNGEPSNVDDDDDVVDATPLEIPDEVNPDNPDNPDEPSPEPTPDPIDPDEPDPDPVPDPDPDPDEPDTPDEPTTPEPADPDPDPVTPTPSDNPDSDPDNPDNPDDPDRPDVPDDPDPDEPDKPVIPDDPDPNPDNPDEPDEPDQPDQPDNPPTNIPTDTPDDPNQPAITNDDGRVMYNQRIDEDVIDSIDKRQFIRYNVNNTAIPVAMEKTDNVSGLIDVSRGGVAVKHNNTLKAGDIIPVHIAYGDLDIHANAKVITATTSRAGAQFVNLDQATANQLLYLNMLLDGNQKVSFK